MASRDQVLAKSIQDIKDVQKAGMYGNKDLTPALKEAHEGLRARWEILKKKAPSMNQSDFDKEAKNLHADTNKAMGAATTARKAKDFEEQKKGARARVRREATSRADTPATPPADPDAKQAPGGVDPEAAEEARAATKGKRKEFAPKQGTFGPDKNKMRAGLVKAYAKAHPEALKKATALAQEAGHSFGKISLGSQLHYLVEAEGGESKGRSKMLKWVKSTKGGTAAATAPAPKPDAPKPPATTTTAAPKKGKGKGKWKGDTGKGSILSQQQAKDFFETLKPAQQKQVLGKLGNPDKAPTGNSLKGAMGEIPKIKAAAIKYRESLSTTPNQRAAAESRAGKRGKGKPATVITPATADTLETGIVGDKTPEALRARADELEAHAKMRDKGRNARGGSATNKGEGFPTNKEIAADLREEAKGLRERAAEAESGKGKTQARQAAASKRVPGPQPSPNQIDEKPVTKVKPKVKAKPKVPASPGPDAWHRGDMTPRQKAADTRLRNERARVARMEKIEADMKAGEPKRKAKAARIEKNKANRKAVAEVFESEGLTPKQAKTKAGREAVDDMRKIQGKQGVLESSKKPLTKLQKAARVAGDVTMINRIPPGVLSKLGTAFRLAGSAAGVYEVGRMSYMINEKGLAQAMRDDDVGTPIVGYVEKKTRAPGMGKLPKAVEDRSKVRETSTKSTIPSRPTYTRADAIRREGGGKKDAARRQADAKDDVALLAQLSKAKDLRGAKKQALMNNPFTGAEEMERDAEWHKKQDVKIARVKARIAAKNKKKSAAKKAAKKAAGEKAAIAKDKAENTAFLKRVLKRRGEAGKEKAASDYKRRVARESLRGTGPTRAESKAEAKSSAASAIQRMKRARADAKKDPAPNLKSQSKVAGANAMRDAAARARKSVADERERKRIDAQTQGEMERMGVAKKKTPAAAAAERVFPASELKRLLGRS